MVTAGSGKDKRSKVVSISEEIENIDANPLKSQGYTTLDDFATASGLPVKSITELARSKKGGAIPYFMLGGREVVKTKDITNKFDLYMRAKSISNADKLQRARQIASTKAYIVKIFLANEFAFMETARKLAVEKKLNGAYNATVLPGAIGTGQAPIVNGKIKNAKGSEGLLIMLPEYYAQLMSFPTSSKEEESGEASL